MTFQEVTIRSLGEISDDEFEQKEPDFPHVFTFISSNMIPGSYEN